MGNSSWSHPTTSIIGTRIKDFWQGLFSLRHLLLVRSVWLRWARFGGLCVGLAILGYFCMRSCLVSSIWLGLGVIDLDLFLCFCRQVLLSAASIFRKVIESVLPYINYCLWIGTSIWLFRKWGPWMKLLSHKIIVLAI